MCQLDCLSISARDIWKKRYFEEKKKTGPFEEQCNRLRHELDIIHKKLLTTLEGPREKATKLQDFKPPSNKVGLTTGTVSQDYGTTSPHWAPHQSRSPAPLTVSSPRRGNSSRLELSPIRRSSLSPTRRRDISPGKKIKIPYVLTSRNLEKVQKQKAQSFHKTQYPVSLIGTDDKKQLLEKELFYDSNLNSPEPSNRSPYNSGASRGYESPRKNVQFDNTVAVIPQEGN